MDSVIEMVKSESYIQVLKSVVGLGNMNQLSEILELIIQHNYVPNEIREYVPIIYNGFQYGQPFIKIWQKYRLRIPLSNKRTARSSRISKIEDLEIYVPIISCLINPITKINIYQKLLEEISNYDLFILKVQQIEEYNLRKSNGILDMIDLLYDLYLIEYLDNQKKQLIILIKRYIISCLTLTNQKFRVLIPKIFENLYLKNNDILIEFFFRVLRLLLSIPTSIKMNVINLVFDILSPIWEVIARHPYHPYITEYVWTKLQKLNNHKSERIKIMGFKYQFFSEIILNQKLFDIYRSGKVHSDILDKPENFIGEVIENYVNYLDIKGGFQNFKDLLVKYSKLNGIDSYRRNLYYLIHSLNGLNLTEKQYIDLAMLFLR